MDPVKWKAKQLYLLTWWPPLKKKDHFLRWHSNGGTPYDKRETIILTPEHPQYKQFDELFELPDEELGHHR